MTKRILTFLLVISGFSAAFAQGDTVAVEKKTTLADRFHQGQQYLDSAAKRKVDPRYIEVPAKPWRVILRYKNSEFDVDYNNSIIDPSTGERADWQLRFEPPMASSVGIWAGYRGTGLSIATSLKKKEGTTFAFSTTGTKYGFNLRYRKYKIDKVSFNATHYEHDKKIDHIEEEGYMPSPVKIGSLYLNGYYVFNGRRYSQAAAYNQSVIQRRSAGSFLVGATWYMSSFNFANKENAPFIVLSHNMNRIQLHQANIGVGYGYNLVPFRGFVVNAMVMPTVSAYNRVKTYKYSSNYKLIGDENEINDYGEWNSQTHTWANGKTQKPLGIDNNESDWMNDVELWEGESETSYGKIQFNVDLRLGIAYNWSNYFIGLQAQFNQFSLKKDQCKVDILDAYARLSLGIRL